MSIHLRKRGEIWHARGTVRVGQDVIPVPQFSTGCHQKGDAEAVAARRESEIRANHLSGESGRQSSLTLNHAIFAYINRAGGLKQYDADRIREIAEHVGTYALKSAPEAWAAFLNLRCAKVAPATIARWRAVFVAALRFGCQALNAGEPPKIPGVHLEQDERVVYLPDKQRQALLGAYNNAAGRVAVTLAYAGLRTQEALRLDWRYVDFERRTLFVANHGSSSGTRTKTGRGRSVPMHDRVYEVLRAEWERQKQPQLGTVFLNRKNQPYRDTRGIGGNPISKAHQSACLAAGVTEFRVHDWRHDFASRCVMSGMDLETLRRIMGWTSLRMAARYVWLTEAHMRDGIAKLA